MNLNEEPSIPSGVDPLAMDHQDEDEDDLEDLLTCPGIVHRSPRIEGSNVTRLVLVLDIPAEFHDDEEVEPEDK